MFDRVIVSCDDSHFKDFWIIVARAWQKYFPEKKLSLAFVTERSEDDELVKKMRNYGEVHLFPVVSGIPTPNLAKMARHILASNYGNEVCMIEDIDTVPLQRGFIERITSQRELGKILFVGREVYKGSGSDDGKFPISNITGESYLFKRIINPNNLSVENLFKSWCNIKVFDNKESICNTPDLSGVKGFSDESLWRVLLHKSELSDENFCFVERLVDVRQYWIDRSWWNIDKNKLESDVYVLCNFIRPLLSNYQQAEPVLKHIFGKEYNKQSILL